MNQSKRQQRYIHVQTYEISNFRYSNLFYGHCNKCHIFGHKAIDCRRVKVKKDENFIFNKYLNFRSKNSPLEI